MYFAYIAQKSVEPVFNLDTNYFKPNRLKNLQIFKFSKVMSPFCNIKVYMLDYFWYFPCQSNIAGLRLWLMALMLVNGTLQNFLQNINVFDNFTFIYNYTREND